MSASKTPPERIMRYWDERVGSLMHRPYPGDTPVEYILASVVEKRERALREALSSIACSPHCMYESNGASSYGTGVADGHRCAAKTARDALDALAAADEVETKPNE